ncbi:MAG TPA: hypothetical protein VIM70_07995 [Clostridium sp.]|uniref:hypothetical protein n=1 Tax=Clostridium sp. TaxID=1506 RepID=UPI002F94D76C
MNKIRVELLNKGTNEMEEYEVITRDEAIEAIGNFNIAETLVDYARSQLGCIIEIDLETSEVYTRLQDGTFYSEDDTTMRVVANIDAYYDLDSLSEIVGGYNDFSDFEKQYEDWEDEIERKYDFEFDDDKYRNVYEAYVVEVLKKDIEMFHRSELIETMGENIGCGIYENTEKFYDEAKVITEL